MKIAIACDHGAFDYKQEVIKLVEGLGHEVKDFGCYDTNSVDYPDVVIPACQAVSNGEFDRGIVMCGTGIGVSMTANKIKGIRCALVSDVFTAHTTREHNDTNVLAMGQRVIGIEVCKEIVTAWLNTPFSNDERHIRRIEKVMKLEEE